MKTSEVAVVKLLIVGAISSSSLTATSSRATRRVDEHTTSYFSPFQAGIAATTGHLRGLGDNDARPEPAYGGGKDLLEILGAGEGQAPVSGGIVRCPGSGRQSRRRAVIQIQRRFRTMIFRGVFVAVHYFCFPECLSRSCSSAFRSDCGAAHDERSGEGTQYHVTFLRWFTSNLYNERFA